MAFVDGSPVAEGSSGQCHDSRGPSPNSRTTHRKISHGRREAGGVFPTLSLVKVRYDFPHVHQLVKEMPLAISYRQRDRGNGT